MKNEKFVIQGGRALKGEFMVRGAKNAAFPILAATLLTDQECIIENVPRIEDVFRMIEILQSLGKQIVWIKEHSLKIKGSTGKISEINKDVISMLRGSVLVYGPLLAKFKEVELPQPGGCLIGVRPIYTHLDAFSQMGVKIFPEKILTKGYRIDKDESLILKLQEKPKPRTVLLNEFSVTATENIMLFASLLPFKTIIKIASEDYAIQELSKFLTKMGVKVNGAGTNTIIIEGKKKLKGASHHLIYDPIEAGTLVLTAATTKSEIVIRNVEIDFLELFLKRLMDFGLPIEILGNHSLRVKPWRLLKIDKIQGLPYPGIHCDLLSAFGVLATQTPGTTLIHDPLYEGRFGYLQELNKMGARIIFADPHRVVVDGPTPLHGTNLGSIDIRGGMALIMAGLVAHGKTTIDNIYQVDRGYERIEERLQQLGASIERVRD